MQNKAITVTLNPCIDKTITLRSFCEGGLNRAEDVRIDAGGKGINVAKVLKRLGGEPHAMGVLGRGGSQAIIQELERRKIEHEFYMTDGETRTNYKLFDREKHQITEVNESGFSVDAEALTAFMQQLEARLPEAAVLVLAGSCPKGAPADVYARLIQLAHKHKVKTILDADGAPFVFGLAALPYAIKPNRFELEQLHGSAFADDAAMYDYCRTILERGVQLMIVSMGAEGAAFFSRDEAYRVTLPPVVVQSTVGAGDSMVAAAAFGVQRNLPLQELARLATAAGTVTASKSGTEVCTYEEVKAFMPKLNLKTIW